MVKSGQRAYLGERPASILWQVESIDGIEAILIDKEGTPKHVLQEPTQRNQIVSMEF